MENLLTSNKVWQHWHISDELKQLLDKSSNVILPEKRDELIELSTNGKENLTYKVVYNVEGKGEVTEAEVIRCKNGIAVNYTEAYMRRRDPNCMVVNNIEMTDKVTFQERFNKEFEPLRKETFDWLSDNEIIIVPFKAGGTEYEYQAKKVAPKNAAFFAASIYDLQGMIPTDKLERDFEPKAIIYVAPPFRHSHFEGKQVVVHNQQNSVHEVFSYNLYQLIGSINPDIKVIRNDEYTVEEIEKMQPSHIIISPGPGKPKDAGMCEEAIAYFKGKVPILGVCLGHQAICEVFGATVSYAKELMHGKMSVVTVDNQCKLFEHTKHCTQVARYHSLIALKDTIPGCLQVTAVTEDGEIMAVRHKEYEIYGVQFHPESILTPEGKKMVESFLEQ